MESPTPITIAKDDLASPWERLGAAIIDGLLMGVPWGFVMVILFLDGEPASARVPLSFTLAGTVLAATYEIVGTALFGQTVGKHVVGIRVCSGRDLDRPGWLRAGKRWGIYLVAGYVPFVGWLLTALIPLPLTWDQNRQGLHDKFADTLVLRNHAVPWAG